ncbi:hypothetical protein RvY_03436-1 [Ramazzottius varieornatus]|uniref:Reverse transcriptase domain-containing protein n=1 Tax=Ramazzottius varieornatus TaxID=947166 RepID=A0A1D1UY98_RAMVA|nr:hypothetical protein RvY_03436-1 [Ramazzottius varieornatus]
MEAARGLQQGDPLGPLLFCLVIENLTQTLKSPLNVWFLDDDSIGGEIGRVLSDLQVVVEEGRKLGLELNPSKCELFAFGGSLQERHASQEAAATACPGPLPPKELPLSTQAPLHPSVLSRLEGPVGLGRLRRGGS